MKFSVIGDIHSNLKYLQLAVDEIKKHEVDVVFLTGDLSNVYIRNVYNFELYAKYEVSINKVFNLLDSQKINYYFVPGNHDSVDILKSHSRNIDKLLLNINNLSIFGIGGAPIGFGWPYEWAEQDIERLSKNIPDKLDIVLSHCPPYGIGDFTPRVKNLGSKALKSICEKTRYFLCGHIHEADGIYHKEKFTVINAGAYGHPEPACRVFIVDTDTHSCKKIRINDKQEIIESIKDTINYNKRQVSEGNLSCLYQVSQEYEETFEYIKELYESL